MNTSAIGISVFTSLLLYILQPGSAQFLDMECGIRSPPIEDWTPRIVNGRNAEPTSSPWMVYILKSTNEFTCGGSLITNRLVLTAAHCYYFNNQSLKVVLGEYNRDWENDICFKNIDNEDYCPRRKLRYVDLGIMHPNYNTITKRNDLAILRMVRPVEYTENIKPICIVVSQAWRNYIDNINFLTVTGWGFTRPQGGEASSILQTLKMQRQRPEYCLIVNNNLGYTDLCLGNPGAGSNACNGDSGGPAGALIQYRDIERFIQIGVASIADQRCSYGSIFTDVLSHVDWILGVAETYGNRITTRVGPTTWYTGQQWYPTIRDNQEQECSVQWIWYYV